MFARIDGQDMPVVSASIKDTLDAIPTFDVVVPAAGLDWRNLQLADIALYRDGELVISGFIDSAPQVQKLSTGDPLMIKFGCMGELGRLTLYRAKHDAHYQEQPITSIIGDLLTMTGGLWLLTNTSTMIDPNIVTTIDLRSKESLFAQITDVVKATPQVHLRYAGFNGAQHELHLGDFNEQTVLLTQGDNLINLKLQRSTERAVRVCESYGERSSNKKVALSDALAHAPTLAHPKYTQFPITLDPITGTYVVTNTALSKGAAITKRFGMIKTKNDKRPSNTQRRQAGYALWLKTVRFLEQNVFYETYSADAKLDTFPKVGDRAYVIAHAEESVYNPVTQQSGWETTFDVNTSLRVVKVSYDFDNETYQLELSTNDEAEQIDPDLAVFERLEARDTSDLPEDAIGFNVQSVVVTHLTSTPADCNYPGGAAVDGKTFIMTAPTPPTWATTVSVTYSLDPITAKANIVTYPVNPGDSLELCVVGATNVWPAATDVTVTATYTYTE